MTINAFINLDARFIADLLAELQSGASRIIGRDTSELCARLSLIAAHIESMDAKLARHIDGTFAQGAAFGQAKALESRSNFSKSRVITNAEGETVIAALAQSDSRKFTGRVPMGTSGLKKAEPAVIEIDETQGVAARRGFRLKDL